MILVCLGRCESVDVKPWDQRKDKLPKGLLESLGLFRSRCEKYLRRLDERCRILKEDTIDPNQTEDVVMAGCD